jgi:hypothetical protein
MKKIKTYFFKWVNALFEYRKELFFSFIFLIIAIIFHYISGNFVMNNPNTAIVPDLLLDRLPYVHLPLVHVYLFLFTMILFFAYPIFLKPKKLPLVIVYFSLFIMVRSIFICLTHMKTPALQSPVIYFPEFLQPISFQNDLFFSGHTGLPFLAFLTYNKTKLLRYFFLVMSIFLGALVLLMRLHYSIDVFAAYFITYGVYKIGERFFEKRFK